MRMTIQPAERVFMERLSECVRQGPDIDAAAAVAAFAGDINTRDEFGYAILLVAIMYNRPLTIDALAARGDCNPNVKSLVLPSPLHRAAYDPSGVMLKVLLTRFSTIKVDLRDNDGWAALHFAAVYGDESNVELLLDAGANPTLKDVNGSTPTQVARKSHHSALADKLAAAEVWFTRAAWITACVVAVVDK